VLLTATKAPARASWLRDGIVHEREHEWIVTFEPSGETFTFADEDKAREFVDVESRMRGMAAVLARLSDRSIADVWDNSEAG
jgi:hypothetical protein